MYNIFFVINHASKKAHISTTIKTLYPIIKTNGAGMGFTLNRKEPAMRPKMKRLEDLYWKIDEYCVSHPTMSAKDIKAAFTTTRKKGELPGAIRMYASSGKVGESTKAIIERTAAKVEDYDPSAGFGIDEGWLDGFCKHLKEQGTSVNGIGLHLRNIRTVFNWARRKKMTKEYPFLDYQIKVENKAVRNMSLAQLRELRDYPCEAWQREYRDIFILMVYLAGVNIGDLLLCEKLVNGRLVYSRQKTGKQISIKVYPEAMEIIERYKGEGYLINPMNRYKDYHGYMHRMNNGLKKIGKVEIVPDKVGKMRKHKVTPVFDGLSTYVARYTFASIAAECGIERDVIAACLGHSWADVTSHYIAYSQKQIDDAVKKVIAYINSDKILR